MQVNRRTNYIWCWRHCFKLLPTAGNNWEFNPEQSHLLKILLEENCCQIQSNLFSLPLIWQLQSEWKPRKHLHVCTVRAPLGPYFNFHISAWVEAIMAIDMSNMCSSYWEGKKKSRLLYQLHSKNKVAKLFLLNRTTITRRVSFCSIKLCIFLIIIHPFPIKF